MDAHPHLELVLLGARGVVDADELLQLDERLHRPVGGGEAQEGPIPGGVHHPPLAPGEGLGEGVEVALLELAPRLIPEPGEVGGAPHHVQKASASGFSKRPLTRALESMSWSRMISVMLRELQRAS